MRSVTENISDKEHRWATRELQVAVDAIPATATGTGFVHVTSGAQDAAAMTGTQVTALLDPFTSTLQGVAPASGGGTTNFLRADGAWTAPPTSTTGVFLVSTITAPTAFDWTGLNGDATGLVEFRIYINVKRSLLAGFTLGARLNNDSGANYRVAGATPTSVTVALTGGTSTNNLAQGMIVIPNPLSGSMRLIDGSGIMATDDLPESFLSGGAGFWTNAGAITRITLPVTAGAIDAGSTASLYRVVSQ